MAKQVALYKIPETLETARILNDSVLDAYIDSIKPYSPKARETLGKLEKADGDLTNSNPFILVHLQNSGLLPNNARLATRKDLETAISFDNTFLSGNYVDFGYVLRTEGDSYKPNDLLAKTLARQLKDRNIKLGKGLLIPFSVLSNEDNINSEYGLIFNLNEKATKENIIDVNEFKWDYTRDTGLVRAYLDRLRYLNSSYEYLADSSDDGRAVVVSAEADSQNFEELLTQKQTSMQESKQEYFAKIQKIRNQIDRELKRK
jgi:hypothetical protein